MKNLQFVFTTAKDNVKDTLIFKFVEKSQTQFDFTWIDKNTRSLAEIYNKEIENSLNKNNILVFLHDDCIPEDLFIQEKLNDAIQQFDIVGLAGIQAPITLKPPCLWHLMGPPTQYSTDLQLFD